MVKDQDSDLFSPTAFSATDCTTTSCNMKDLWQEVKMIMMYGYMHSTIYQILVGAEHSLWYLGEPHTMVLVIHYHHVSCPRMHASEFVWCKHIHRARQRWGWGCMGYAVKICFCNRQFQANMNQKCNAILQRCNYHLIAKYFSKKNKFAVCSMNPWSLDRHAYQ